MDQKLKEGLLARVVEFPPLTAIILWDVLQGRADAHTIELAGHADDADWEFTLVRAVAGWNPEALPIAGPEIDILLEEALEQIGGAL